MKLGRCPICNGRFQVPITWGENGVCIDCYVGEKLISLHEEQQISKGQ